MILSNLRLSHEDKSDVVAIDVSSASDSDGQLCNTRRLPKGQLLHARSDCLRIILLIVFLLILALQSPKTVLDILILRRADYVFSA